MAGRGDARMRKDLVELFETARVPRYTSYPTAPHFSAAVDDDVYGGWLAGLKTASPASLYLHVPYCASLCWYCGCSMQVTRHEGRIAAMVDLIGRELALVEARLPDRPALSHVHWGGGTPSIIGADAFLRLMRAVERVFAVRGEAERAIEIDPRTLDEPMVEALAAAGINRASLGVQSFDETVQRAINRVQSPAMTGKAAAALRRAGIAALSVDILYGLPHQTVANCVDSVRRVLEMAPDRVSVFGYAHLPNLKRHQRMIDEEALPDARRRLDQFEAIAATLAEAGFEAVGLDHFARPDDAMAVARRAGRLRRNFQGYTTDEAEVLLGIGPSAIGSLAEGYVQNHAGIADYRRAIEAGRLATARGVALSVEDRARRAAIERVMCDGAVDVGAVATAFDLPPARLAPDPARLDELERLGIARRTGDRVSVAGDCRPLVRLVAAAFDSYLAPSPHRHATAL